MTQPSTFFDPRATREHLEMGFQIAHCPVCGAETLDSHWLCRNCGWEYDSTTEESEYSSCNMATVADYRKNSL